MTGIIIPARAARSSAIAAAILLLTLTTPLRSETFNWDAGGINDNWSNPANWNPDGVPTTDGSAELVFNVNVPPSFSVVDGAGAWSILSLTFGPLASAFTISGNPISILSGGITNNGTQMQRVTNSLVVGGAMPLNAASGNLTIGAANTGGTVQLRAFPLGSINATGSSDTTIYSNIFGGSSNSLVKNGTGTLTLVQPSGVGLYSQSYTGPTTVNEGTLVLNQVNTAGTIAGDLNVGDGGVGGVDTVRLDRINQISEAIGNIVTVASTGVLNLNGHNETIRDLTVSGGSVTTGAGILTVLGTIASSGGVTGTISGNLNLSGARTFDIASGAGANNLDVSAAMATGSLTKVGLGTLLLSGALANTYTGTTAVNDGVLALGKTIANGAVRGALVIGDRTGGGNSAVVRLLASNQIDEAAPNPVTINPDGWLDLGVFSETLREIVMTGGMITIGTGGTLTLSGTFTSSGDTTIPISGHVSLGTGPRMFNIGDGIQATDVAMTGIISGGTLTKAGFGTLEFSGSAANTYTGATTINEGVLLLSKIAAEAVPGPLIIGDGIGIADSAEVRLGANNQIAETTGHTVTINSDGRLDLGGFVDSFRDIVMTGSTIANSGTGVLTLLGSLTTNVSAATANITSNLALAGAQIFSVANGSAPIDLSISGIISNSGGSSSITKMGAGALALTGTNTFSGGLTLNGGTLLVGNNSAAGSGSLVLQSGNLQASGAAQTLANPVVLAGAVTVDGPENLTISGAISGTGDLAKNDNGTLTFSAASTTINGDILLNAGALTTAELIIMNTGTFTQAGGTYTGTLTNRGAFIHNGGSFSGPLTNEGSATFNGAFTTINQITNPGNITVSATGTLTANGLGISSSGSLTLSGGTISGTGPLVNSGSLTGFGVLGGSGGLTNQSFLQPVGGNLTLSNSGTNTNSSIIEISGGRALVLNGVGLTNSGTITLAPGNISGSGTLTNASFGIISGAGNISASLLNQSGALLSTQGGTLTVAIVTNAGRISVTTNLAGGTIASSGRIEGGGNIGSTINNTGVIEPLAAATLTLTGTLTNAAAGMISLPAGTTIQNLSGFTVNDGTISLAGGTLTKTGALTNNGTITGRGTIQTGGLTNEGTLDFTAGTTTINGDVINNDTVRTTNATITFNGTYTENGTLHSDPSDHFFATLNVGIAGKIEAGAGDRFFINGNFSNGSTQALTWDTTVAELVFQNGPAHTFALAGRDVGAIYAGFADNFEWGTLRLQTGQSLSLSDGNATAGAAFYASAVILAGGTAQIPSITGNGFNIYYDVANSANAYLANSTYPLTGGGSLIPVPEPSSVLMLALGAGLASWPNRRPTRRRFSCSP